MLQADAGARKRLFLILLVFAVLMGSLIVSGMVQRLSGAGILPGAESSQNAQEEIREIRAVRATLAKLGRERKWGEAATYAESRGKDGQRLLIRFLNAEAQVYAGDFESAAKEFRESLRGGDPTVEAARLVFAGNGDEYRRFCERYLAQVPEGNTDHRLNNNTAWLCALQKDSLKDYSRPLDMARQAVESIEDPADRWIYLNTRGVLQFRAGQYEESIKTLREAEERHPDPFNWPFLAMAYARTGDSKQREYWRKRFTERLMNTYATNELSQNRHELLLFYHEMEEMLGRGTVARTEL